MEADRLLVLVLYLLGFILPVAGALLVVYRTSRTLRDRDRKEQKFDEIYSEWKAKSTEISELRRQGSNADADALNAEFHGRFKAEGLSVPSYENADVTGERSVGRTIRLIAQGNTVNGLIVILGLLSSTVASIWALFLPSA